MTHCDASADADLPVCEVEREPDASESLRTYGAVVQALPEYAGSSRAELAEWVRLSTCTVESAKSERRMPDGGPGRLRRMPAGGRDASVRRGPGR